MPATRVSQEIATATGGMLGVLTAVSLGAQLLTIVFAASLVATAVALFRQQEEGGPQAPQERGEGELGAHFYDPSLRREVRYRVQRLPLGMGFGLLAGFLSGLLGIGAGVIEVPAMVLGMRVPVKAATATSNFMIGVTAVASAYIYYARGYVNAPLTAAVVIGVFFGSLAGARLAPYQRSVVLTRGLALVLAGVAILMVLRVLGFY